MLIVRINPLSINLKTQCINYVTLKAFGEKTRRTFCLEIEKNIIDNNWDAKERLFLLKSNQIVIPTL